MVVRSLDGIDEESPARKNEESSKSAWDATDVPLPFDLFSSDDRREHRLLPLFAVEMHGGRRGRAQPRPRGLGRVRRQRAYRIIRSRLLPCFGIQSRLRKLVVLAMFPILLFWVLRYRAPVLHLGNFSPDILTGWPMRG